MRKCRMIFNRNTTCGIVLLTIPFWFRSGNNVTGQVNVYDMRFFDPTGGAIWPYAVVYMAEYLADPQVLLAVHVDNRSVWSVSLKRTFWVINMLTIDIIGLQRSCLQCFGWPRRRWYLEVVASFDRDHARPALQRSIRHYLQSLGHRTVLDYHRLASQRRVLERQQIHLGR